MRDRLLEHMSPRVRTFLGQEMERQRWAELQRGEPVHVRAGRLVRTEEED